MAETIGRQTVARFADRRPVSVPQPRGGRDAVGNPTFIPFLLHLLEDDGLPFGVARDHLAKLVRPCEVDLAEIVAASCLTLRHFE